MGLLLQQDIQQVGCITQCTRDDQRIKSHVLIGNAVIPGQSALAREVFGTAASIDRPHRHDKAHPIDRGDLTPAPGAGDGNRGLRRNQARIGSCERLRTQIILLHPGQPLTGERGIARLNQRLQPNVTGLRDQHRTDAQRQIGHAGTAITDMRKLVSKAGHRLDFQQNLRQIDPWHDILNIFAQGPQRQGIVQFIEAGDNWAIMPINFL